jgi:N-acetylglucosaminyldiphosphoundecaprenol N-acetyl-beta-D-mannosaminyltransferase
MAHEGSSARHFLYGGAQGVAEELAGVLTDRFPKIEVVGHYSPPFKEAWGEPDEEEIAMIQRSGAEVVWVGLGHPKQEIWMRAHSERLPGVALAGVGAAFDFHTGRTKESPAWMKKAGLQWLHRLLSEPRRLWRRYLIGNTRFALLVARQWITEGRRLRAKRGRA